MSAETPKISKYSRRAKILFCLGGALVVYAAVGFLVAPAVIQSQMLKRLPVMLKRPVAVGEVKVNPFALSVAIDGFAVKETSGAAFAGWDHLYASLNFSSFLQHGWSVQEISLTHPFAQIVRGKNGSLNFDDILATLGNSTSPAPAPAAKTALPLVMIDILRIDGADITVDDFVPTTPVHTKLLPIHVRLEHLSTAGGAHNPYEISAVSDSHESFQWSGTFTLDPPQVSGSFVIEQLDLKKYSPYLANFANAGVLDGRLDAKADYTAGLDTNGPDISLTKCGVSLKSLAVKSTISGETVLTMPSLSVLLSEASLAKKLVHVLSIDSIGGALLVHRDKDGAINLLQLLKTPPPSAAPTNTPAATQAPWTAMADDISLDDYSLSVEDDKPSQPARLAVDKIILKVQGFNTASNAPVDLDLSLRLGESGLLTVRGNAHLQPPSADLSVNLIGLDLRPFQPYVQQQVQLAITSGMLSLQGQAHYTSEKGSPLAAFAGNVGLTNFATADLLHYKDFVKFDSLAVTGINFAFQPNQLQVGEVRLGGLSTSVMVDANNKINLLTVLPTNAPPSSNTPAAGLDFPVSLSKLAIDNASFHFSDQSIEPNCVFDIQELDGSVTALSSRPDSRAAVDLHGKVDDVSSFSVQGTANPLSKDLSMDVSISCKNVNLTPFTPYMEKFGGYPLQRGKLLVDLHHQIAAGRLTASNHVIIAGLTLGPNNHSPDATHLPVKLGVALLKDREGNITLDVPLSGSLNNPDFRIGPIIGQIIGNILGKAATSPFTLLGAVFGGGGDELSYIDFQPGLAGIPASELPKLDKLAKALYERPALELEITGAADPVADSSVLARLKLQDQIRSMRARELIAAGNPAETVQSVQLDPADYSRLLKSLYAQTIATNPSAASAIVNSPASGSPNIASSSTPFISSSAPVSTVPRDRSTISVKGGELLMQDTSSEPVTRNPAYAPPPPEQITPLPSPGEKSAEPAAEIADHSKSAPPLSPGESSQGQMEAVLLAQIQITPDDLRALMQARARSVQIALVKSGKVEGERLFILAPQPISLSAKGQSRANLSLE